MKYKKSESQTKNYSSKYFSAASRPFESPVQTILTIIFNNFSMIAPIDFTAFVLDSTISLPYKLLDIIHT